MAVKQLKVGSRQGEQEFCAEVEIISRVHHRHLVSLVGYCIADSQRLLVYDYVPNGTLEYHLHGRKLLLDIELKLLDCLFFSPPLLEHPSLFIEVLHLLAQHRECLLHTLASLKIHDL